MFLRMLSFLCQFVAGYSYKRSSYKKKSVHKILLFALPTLESLDFNKKCGIICNDEKKKINDTKFLMSSCICTRASVRLSLLL